MNGDRKDNGMKREIDSEAGGGAAEVGTRDPNTLVPSRRAAAMLGIKPQTLRRWRYGGKGPSYVRLGGNKGCPVAYRFGDLLRWIESRRYRSTSEETVANDEAIRSGRRSKTPLCDGGATERY